MFMLVQPIVQGRLPLRWGQIQFGVASKLACLCCFQLIVLGSFFISVGGRSSLVWRKHFLFCCVQARFRCTSSKTKVGSHFCTGVRTYPRGPLPPRSRVLLCAELRPARLRHWKRLEDRGPCRRGSWSLLKIEGPGSVQGLATEAPGASCRPRALPPRPQVLLGGQVRSGV